MNGNYRERECDQTHEKAHFGLDSDDRSEKKGDTFLVSAVHEVTGHASRGMTHGRTVYLFRRMCHNPPGVTSPDRSGPARWVGGSNGSRRGAAGDQIQKRPAVPGLSD